MDAKDTAKVHAFLRAIEWTDANGLMGEKVCERCWRLEHEGHTDNCDLAEALLLSKP